MDNIKLLTTIFFIIIILKSCDKPKSSNINSTAMNLESSDMNNTPGNPKGFNLNNLGRVLNEFDPVRGRTIHLPYISPIQV